MKRAGKIGLANIEARKRIAAICEQKGLNRCEVGFDGCLKTWTLAPAHKHPRSWYGGDVEKLSDYNEFVVCCSHCHSLLDGRSHTSQEEADTIFARLRPVL